MCHSTVLIDVARAQQFWLVGKGPRITEDFTAWIDADGVAWAAKKFGNHWLAATWLAPGWAFEKAIPSDRMEDLAIRRQAMATANDAVHRQELCNVMRRIRLGVHAERILLTVHHEVMRTRRSVIRIPDIALARSVWGAGDHWPRNWRRDLAQVLHGLTWLHLAEVVEGNAPVLGAETAIFHHAADLREDPDQNECSDECPARQGPAHSHFLVNCGRGLLGILEDFAQPALESGVRTYDFPVSGGRRVTPNLWRVGKTGRLMSVFLPAKLGEPTACATLTKWQHQLLQAIFRELTRKARKDRRGPTDPAVFRGNHVKDLDGRGERICPYLTPNTAYVVFGGNGKRKGLGYRIGTAGGWLSKAGYPSDGIQILFRDLAKLCSTSGLIVVGLHRRTRQWFSLERMVALATSGVGRADLDQLHLRIYAAADFLERWCDRFGWRDFETHAATPPLEQLHQLLENMARRGITRRALAQALGMDPSFVTKLLNGKKPWPAGQMERAQRWVEADLGQHSVEQISESRALAPQFSPSTASFMAHTALECLQCGWSIVPVRPGTKRPCIRWKAFQQRLATEDDVADWFQTWPNAGLAVVLGPISNLVVVDVDGQEAHAVLVERLGGEPAAPKSLSGSHEPYRYHLFFRDPGFQTKAKTTPWHPHLEFRGCGGLVVIPPSLHPSGQRYAWETGRSPADLTLPPLPDAIRAVLVPRPRRLLTQQGESPAVGTTDASDSTMRFLAGEYAEGPRWNDRLFAAACDLCAREVPITSAEPLLMSGAKPWNTTERENAIRTIRSAYSQPREPARI